MILLMAFTRLALQTSRQCNELKNFQTHQAQAIFMFWLMPSVIAQMNMRGRCIVLFLKKDLTQTESFLV